MATSGQLIEAVHRATGLAMATVIDLDRKLVKGGLRNKTGRGLHAAHMTPLDAARLLTAVLASPQANTAAEAVGRYSRTRRTSPMAQAGKSAASFASLSSLPADHSFVDAIAAMLAAIPTSSMTRAPLPQIETSALTHSTRASIRIITKGKSLSVDYGLPPSTVKVAAKSSNPVAAERVAGDLEQSRRITERTLTAVANCLNMAALIG